VYRMGEPQYRIVVKGELGPRYCTAFEGMTLEPRAGETAIVGSMVDQAQLQGVLDRIASLNLELLSVNPVVEPNGGDAKT
jgi:hypothetical protein